MLVMVVKKYLLLDVVDLNFCLEYFQVKKDYFLRTAVEKEILLAGSNRI